MVGTLILTHGGLAKELLASAQTIVQNLEGFEALSLDWAESLEGAKRLIAQALERLDQGEGVLILTDMYGGTPANLAAHFYKPGKIEIISGVNLPMILRLGCGNGKSGRSVGELAVWLQEKGRRGIHVFGPGSEAARALSETDCKDD